MLSVRLARRFAANGAKVAVHGRDGAAMAAVLAGIEAHGGRAVAVTADLTRSAEIEADREQIEAELGPIDILVANAGANYTPPGPIEEVSEEGWRASIDGNLTATSLMIKSVLPGMKQRKSGNIITLSSAGRPPARSRRRWSCWCQR